MKVFKTIFALLVATFISYGVSAQAASTTAKTTTTQTTTTKTATPDKPGAGDKVNKALKGPNGEVVYTGPKGGNYYISKAGKKTYLKPAAK